MNICAAIHALIEGRDLSAEEMTAVVRQIMGGEATPAQIGGFLVGLRMKGETVEEITAAAKVMRALALSVELPKQYLVDTCGTGGDGLHTFNISTTSAFVVAAAGGRVAKHGNRSVSSCSGSADVLEATGVKIDLDPRQVTRCVEEMGIGFLFAPLHHNAMKHAIGPRRELGIRTLFNLLGPLTNPAGAPNQLLGVYSAEWLEPLAKVLKNLGSRHVLVVHAEDGLDELSLSAPTQVAELYQDHVHCYTVTPEQYGFARADLASITVHSAEESLTLMYAVLDNTPSPALDSVLLNAGAAIYVAGLAESLQLGIDQARRAIASGAARDKLQALIDFTRQVY
jgi:anthranilate phosphoribosyltransferase